jgi:hypothetical protein
MIGFLEILQAALGKIEQFLQVREAKFADFFGTPVWNQDELRALGYLSAIPASAEKSIVAKSLARNFG